MRAKLAYAFVLVIALALVGCSAAPGVSGSPTIAATSSPAAPAAVPSTSVPSTDGATASAPVQAVGMTPGASQPASGDPVVAAIQAAIQKSDQAQQDAFTKNDPTIMKDTATSSYYNELVQTNSDMATGGVSAIKLIGIDWMQVTLTNPTTAQATNYETWQTSYSDGSTDQARELNTYILVQQQGTWLVQSNDHPNSTSSSSGASAGSGPSRSVAPASPTAAVPPALAAPATGASSSGNWAGYASTSGTFTAVTGTWTVPQVMSAGSFGTDATWVGIGGVNTRDLIQAGTEETTGSGATQWDAWIEMLPQPSRPVEFSVHPGDSVTVSISQQSSPNQWLIQMKNNTTGESYQTTVQYQSSLSSAEWIEEAPSAAGRGGRVLPLDNFGTVQFSNGTAVQNGKTVTIAQSGAQPITLNGPNHNALVVPSVLGPEGQSFAVIRAGTAPTP